MLISSLILALFLSIDSFGVGITYGLKNTKIPILPKFILFIIAFIISSISINLGNFISKFLPENVVTVLGVCLLILMGIWVIIQAINKSNTIENNKKSNSPKIYKFFIKSFGITIEIIRNPIYSDLDNSKSIDFKESIYLGIAMSIDALCSGIGISTFGVNSIIFPLLVASFQLLLLSIGNFLGKKIAYISKISPNVCSIISGILLILIGISRLFL